MSETDKQIVIEALGGGPVQVGTGGPAPAGNVTLPLRTVVVVLNQIGRASCRERV